MTKYTYLWYKCNKIWLNNTDEIKFQIVLSAKRRFHQTGNFNWTWEVYAETDKIFHTQ